MNPSHPFVLALVLAAAASAQSSFHFADGPGDTYARLSSAGYGIEVPDCAHKVDHIVERMDETLKKPVFAFTMHMQDNDRCQNYDRQRIELRGSGAAQQGAKGRLTHYRWKFRLDPGFKENGNFTHIFQIKAYGNGHGSGAPIVTLTPRDGNLEIYHRGTVRPAPLSKFKGVWVEAYLKARHDNGGSLEVSLRRVDNGELLHSYQNGNLDLWDDGAGYGAPKFGLYRSLNSRSAMRDEDVLFADIAVTLGEQEVSWPSAVLARPAPVAPGPVRLSVYDLSGRALPAPEPAVPGFYLRETGSQGKSGTHPLIVR